jgi:hypothetical protein
MTRLLNPRLLGSQLLGAEAVPDVTTSVRNDQPLALSHPGRCPSERIVYLNVFDNSGSMSGGNDPIGNRFAEVRACLQHLARHCRCGRELTSILHFDTPTSGDVLPVKLDRPGVRKLEAGLTVPPDGAGISLLTPSLERAEAMAASQPDFAVVLTVLSDFELFDPPGILDRLTNFPGVVHAVVFRSAPPTALVDTPDVLVTSVQPTDPPGAVAHAIFTSMTHLRRAPRRTRQQRKEVSW